MAVSHDHHWLHTLPTIGCALCPPLGSLLGPLAAAALTSHAPTPPHLCLMHLRLYVVLLVACLQVAQATQLQKVRSTEVQRFPGIGFSLCAAVMTRSALGSDPSPSHTQPGLTPGCFSTDASCDAMHHVTQSRHTHLRCYVP